MSEKDVISKQIQPLHQETFWGKPLVLLQDNHLERSKASSQRNQTPAEPSHLKPIVCLMLLVWKDLKFLLEDGADLRVLKQSNHSFWKVVPLIVQNKEEVNLQTQQQTTTHTPSVLSVASFKKTSFNVFFAPFFFWLCKQAHCLFVKINGWLHFISGFYPKHFTICCPFINSQTHTHTHTLLHPWPDAQGQFDMWTHGARAAICKTITDPNAPSSFQLLYHTSLFLWIYRIIKMKCFIGSNN